MAKTKSVITKEERIKLLSVLFDDKKTGRKKSWAIIARLSGISTMHIYFLRNGKCNPSISVLILLCRELGVDIMEIITPMEAILVKKLDDMRMEIIQMEIEKLQNEAAGISSDPKGRKE